MPTSIFETAKVVNPKAKSTSTKDKSKVDIKDVEAICEIDGLISVLKAQRTLLEENIKSQIKDYFVASNSDTRPANFRGVEGAGETSCELRKRSTTSPLTEFEKIVLTQNNIPFGKNVSTQAAFLINPEHTNNKALLKKVSDALLKIDGLPEDFIQFQPEVAQEVVTDESVDAVFKGDASKRSLLLDIVGIFAIKPVALDVDVNNFVKRFKKAIGVK